MAAPEEPLRYFANRRHLRAKRRRVEPVALLRHLMASLRRPTGSPPNIALITTNSSPQKKCREVHEASFPIKRQGYSGGRVSAMAKTGQNGASTSPQNHKQGICFALFRLTTNYQPSEYADTRILEAEPGTRASAGTRHAMHRYITKLGENEWLVLVKISRRQPPNLKTTQVHERGLRAVRRIPRNCRFGPTRALRSCRAGAYLIYQTNP